MELALSLGETPKPFSFHEKSQKIITKDLGFCMGLSKQDDEENEKTGFCECEKRDISPDPPVQLDLLPFAPVQRRTNNQQPLELPPNKFPLPWLHEKLNGEVGKRGIEMKRRGEEISISSPNSVVSSFQMDFSIFTSGKREFINGNNNNNSNYIITRSGEADRGRSCSKGSDDEENGNGGCSRKKLRLSKEQSAFLEDSFKEHNTLNPKQKVALAKQLNLRPRQVEVWFQNRRARTKLKQTEVDCEYLKRCCETLTEENRRLQKELHELRALKASQPFYRQLPATTLTMCPSCERVATTSTTTSSSTATIGVTTPPTGDPSKVFPDSAPPSDKKLLDD